ncbi:hypothetical protein GPJ56_008716 [Histomonas meleagridis]|uniref:uncharacterized protein n=1 Tax=Histomonas meleagridis TaxID=135588 RepID=UPI0035598D1A|nr:hypothetical protein GPJ56_008716 [Histomonas meleagridis]KAH0803293.1 hypothetical protein GO595_004029 [Histomonas meleagridis]
MEKFGHLCQASLEILNNSAIDEASTLNRNLSQIKTYLINECAAKNSTAFIDYLVEKSFLYKFSDFVNSKTPSEFIVPLLDFFHFFVSTARSQLVQAGVHRPVTNILTHLENLDFKCPKETREFALGVWHTCRYDYILFEMMSTFDKNKNKHFPLIDYFCKASLTFTDIGNKSREILFVIVLNPPEKTEPVPQTIIDYTISTLNPLIADALSSILGYAATIQFQGSLTIFLQWVDQYLLLVQQFPIETVFSQLKELNNCQKLIALSFLLSTFMSSVIIDPTINLIKSDEILSLIVNSLKENNQLERNAALTLLKVMMKWPKLQSCLLPAKSSESNFDILSLLPSRWLGISEGSSSTESYAKDAVTRISSYGQRKNDENNNYNIYSYILNLFKDFQNLTINEILSVTQLISLIVSVAPDLINNELADAFKSVVAKYENVELFEIPKDMTKDTKELRAVLLCEFAKEIHSTFIMSEKMKIVNESHNE